MKQLMTDPIHAAMSGVNEGDILEGTVRKTTDAFVEQLGVYGLVHVSNSATNASSMSAMS